MKSWFNNFFRLSPAEIAFAGVFVALWIISSKFISIDLGIMKVGIVYVWIILLGLTVGPFLGMITCLIGDNVALSLGSYGFSAWTWAYAIIPLAIYFMTFTFKTLFKTKNTKLWLVLILTSTICIIGASILVVTIENNFVSTTSHIDAKINISSLLTKILVWSALTVVIVMQLIFIFIYFKNYNQNIKLYLSIFSLVSFIIIFIIWIWGPIAQIIWLNRFGKNAGNNDYWSLYDAYLIGRILKTPVILPIYILIIAPLFKSANLILANKKVTRW